MPVTSTILTHFLLLLQAVVCLASISESPKVLRPLVVMDGGSVSAEQVGGAGWEDAGGGLTIHQKDYVGWRKNVDHYGRQWTGELLTVEHGYQQSWQPGLAYALYVTSKPNGVQYVQMISRNELVLFMVERNAEGEVSLRCDSHPDLWTLKRRGQFVCVEELNGRRFYFETPDIGQAWRLRRFEYVQTPEMGVELDYEAERPLMPQSLIYPDGARAIFRYEGDLLIRMELPTAEWVKLTRDAAGFVAGITMEYAKEIKVKPKMAGFTITSDEDGVKEDIQMSKAKTKTEWESFRNYVFENDAKGRIHRFVNDCGRPYLVEYAEAKVEDDPKGTLYLTALTDETTGDCQFLRHEDKKGGWRLEKGTMKAGDSITEAKPDEVRIRKKQKTVMRTSEIYDGEGNLIQSFKDGCCKV